MERQGSSGELIGGQLKLAAHRCVYTYAAERGRGGQNNGGGGAIVEMNQDEEREERLLRGRHQGGVG
eukprot:5928691-Pleurochrysis_carterae.AAC.5